MVGLGTTLAGVALIVMVSFRMTPLFGRHAGPALGKPAPTPDTSLTSAIAVDGATLKVAGQRFVVKGAAVFMLPYKKDPTLLRFSQQNFLLRNSIFAKMRSIGANVVRLPVGAAGDQATQLQRLPAVVESAKAHHLRVVISWWDSLYMGRHLPTSYQSILPMMRAVRQLVGDDPAVMYEPLNEPNGVSWDAWYRVMDQMLRYWRSGLHYQGLLLIDTIDHSWTFSPSRATALIALDRSLSRTGTANIAFANHRYARGHPTFGRAERRAWQKAIGRDVSRYPLVGTEYGYRDTGDVPHPDWNRGFLDYLWSVEVPRGFNGYIDFVWNWSDANSMTQHGNPRALNEHGSIAKKHFFQMRLKARSPTGASR